MSHDRVHVARVPGIEPAGYKALRDIVLHCS